MSQPSPPADSPLPKVALELWQRDAAPKAMGIELIEVHDGGSSLALTIGPAHANIHQICHGGVLYTLADAACGFATNCHGQTFVTQSGDINYLSPARLGERITASAISNARAGRSRIVDCTLTAEDGRLVALMRALMREIPPRPAAASAS